jgi:hypothetical protein
MLIVYSVLLGLSIVASVYVVAGVYVVLGWLLEEREVRRLKPQQHKQLVR